MTLRMKHGVRALGMRPEILLAIIIADQVYADRGYGCVVTGITDGDHMSGSLHHCGLGIDLRTRHLAKGVDGVIAADLADRLGPGYDVVVEPTHIHVEYDPK